MSDETRQIATLERESGDPGAALAPAQIVALAALAGGGNVSRAADAAGVHRASIYRWLDTDPGFAAELARLRAEQREAITGELASLAGLALETIRTTLERGTNPAVRLRAALAVLDRATDGPAPDPAAFDPAAVKAKMQMNALIRSLG